ncbi:IS110 family transposase [Dyadobacter frigoris]|uniref:IS110 family transposase n=1 Tax=Dyadobacter frigoris TaxID=2576211 RepID=UPI001C6FE759|nr:transposase [Dyadobacter frigoris]GLU55255.1 hypothetical protein Dfri01_47160 [Dyadobacter frigoris]
MMPLTLRFCKQTNKKARFIIALNKNGPQNHHQNRYSDVPKTKQLWKDFVAWMYTKTVRRCDSVFMCILTDSGEKFEEKFGTLTPELERLRQQLCLHHVKEVALESTSIYWVPVWRVLESEFDVKLVNPYFIRQLPGRKTDVKDAHWIAIVLQKGLIKSSFIPDDQIQQLRHYNRKIFYLNRHLQRAEQGMDLILQRCNIRLSNYLSNIGGKSMRKVIKALSEGNHDPQQLVKLVHGRITNKHGIDCIKDSLTGIISQEYPLHQPAFPGSAY